MPFSMLSEITLERADCWVRIWVRGWAFWVCGSSHPHSCFAFAKVNGFTAICRIRHGEILLHNFNQSLPLTRIIGIISKRKPFINVSRIGVIALHVKRFTLVLILESGDYIYCALGSKLCLLNYWDLFWRTFEILLFRRFEQIIKSLCEVFPVARRLCWKFKVNQPEVM